MPDPRGHLNAMFGLISPGQSPVVISVSPISGQTLGAGNHQFHCSERHQPHLAPEFSLALEARGYEIGNRLNDLYSKKKILVDPVLYMKDINKYSKAPHRTKTRHVIKFLASKIQIP